MLAAPLLPYLTLDQEIGQLSRRRRPVLRPLGQAGKHDLIQPGRDTEQTVEGRGLWRGMNVLRHHLNCALSLENVPSGENPVGHTSKRIDVGPLVYGLSQGTFG